MKRRIKQITLCILSVVIFISGCMTAFADTSQLSDEWMNENGVWYYFNYEGTKVTGWHYIQNGKELDKYYFDPSGALQTGWKMLDDYWYYLGDNGVMHHNEWIDNCYLNMNGQYVENTEIIFDKNIKKFDIEYCICEESRGVKTCKDQNTIKQLTEYCTNLQPTEKQLEVLYGASSYIFTLYFEDGTSEKFSVCPDNECLLYNNAEYDIALDMFERLWKDKSHTNIWKCIKNFFVDLFYIFY